MLTIFHLIFKVLCYKTKRPDVWGKENQIIIKITRHRTRQRKMKKNRLIYVVRYTKR